MDWWEYYVKISAQNMQPYCLSVSRTADWLIQRGDYRKSLECCSPCDKRSLITTTLQPVVELTPPREKKVYDGSRVLIMHEVKAKCTLVQELRFCTGRTAHRGSRGMAVSLLDHGTRRGWGVSITPRPLFTTGKEPVPILQEAGWAPGPVWTGAENLAPTGIRSPDCPARSQSLYRLNYPAHW
jgi:hypothetical protein